MLMQLEGNARNKKNISCIGEMYIALRMFMTFMFSFCMMNMEERGDKIPIDHK